MPRVELSRSDNPDKKYRIILHKEDGGKKTVHFGQKGAGDYTTHKDAERKQSYLERHRKGEDWTKRGIGTAGFWSRHLLWNKKSIDESVRDIERKFNVDITRKKK